MGEVGAGASGRYGSLRSGLRWSLVAVRASRDVRMGDEVVVDVVEYTITRATQCSMLNVDETRGTAKGVIASNGSGGDGSISTWQI